MEVNKRIKELRDKIANNPNSMARVVWIKELDRLVNISELKQDV